MFQEKRYEFRGLYEALLATVEETAAAPSATDATEEEGEVRAVDPSAHQGYSTM